MIAATSPAVAIGADAASYAVLVLVVVVSRHFRAPQPLPGGDQSVVRALRMLASQPAVLGTTLLCVAFFDLYGPVEVALPVFVSQTLPPARVFWAATRRSSPSARRSAP